MQKRKRVAVINMVIALFLLVGCQTQTVESKDGSSVKDSAQRQSITVFGASPELLAEAEKEKEKAKEELQTLKKDRSLSGTAKRILAEAEEAEEQGDNKRYLSKIQEYRKLLNDEPIKRAAESWILEGRVLFSQLKLKEAQQAIEKAVQLDSANPEYLLILAEYMEWNGEYKRMLEVSLKAMSRIKSQESLEESVLVDGYSSLGRAYLLTGDYKSAVEPLQKSLELRKKLLGEEHPSVALSINNLAELY
ncbi:MAG: tetratricopeptide repeat protein [Xenococcaceae cyanobacterium]